MAGWFRKLRKALRVLCVAVAVTVLAAWLAGRLVSDHFGWSQWLQWIPTPAALLAAAGRRALTHHVRAALRAAGETNKPPEPPQVPLHQLVDANPPDQAGGRAA